jgi:hypothetical protein
VAAPISARSGRRMVHPIQRAGPCGDMHAAMLVSGR